MTFKQINCCLCLKSKIISSALDLLSKCIHIQAQHKFAQHQAIKITQHTTSMVCWYAYRLFIHVVKHVERSIVYKLVCLPF